MTFKDKKLWIILVLIIGLAANILMHRSRVKEYDRLLAAYDHNGINAYYYLMSITDFTPSIDRLEELYDLENIDDKELIEVSDAFSQVIDHLLQLNSLRGYSENETLLKEEENKVRGFSHKLIYEEQVKQYELINDIYLGFEDFLMDMYQNAIKEKDKVKLEEIVDHIKQIDGTIKSSVNRNINPNDLEELRLEYKRIQPLLDKIEKTLEK